MMIPALRYLTLRALGAPAVLLSLAMQGVFRGFKDTKTPLYATGKITIARAVELDHQTIVIDLPKKKSKPMWFVHFLPCTSFNY